MAIRNLSSYSNDYLLKFAKQCWTVFLIEIHQRLDNDPKQLTCKQRTKSPCTELINIVRTRKNPLTPSWTENGTFKEEDSSDSELEDICGTEIKKAKLK